jgi:putative DNA primase/helicase
VPFERVFKGPDADPRLLEKLHAERSGILNWVLKGYGYYMATGLCIPSSVQAAVEEYRTETDVVAQFVSECCEVGPLHTATAAELYAAFHGWSESQGVPDTRILTKTAFGRRLKLRFEKAKDTATGYVMYYGVTLLPESPEG